MNERIIELQKQCITTDGHVVVNFDYDKFAELIVKECIDVAFQRGDNVDYLKEHFGIEE